MTGIIFADPFGSALDGFRQGEQDEDRRQNTIFRTRVQPAQRAAERALDRNLQVMLTKRRHENALALEEVRQANRLALAGRRGTGGGGGRSGGATSAATPTVADPRLTTGFSASAASATQDNGFGARAAFGSEFVGARDPGFDVRFASPGAAASPAVAAPVAQQSSATVPPVVGPFAEPTGVVDGLSQRALGTQLRQRVVPDGAIVAAEDFLSDGLEAFGFDRLGVNQAQNAVRAQAQAQLVASQRADALLQQITGLFESGQLAGSQFDRLLSDVQAGRLDEVDAILNSPAPSRGSTRAIFQNALNR